MQLREGEVEEYKTDRWSEIIIETKPSAGSKSKAERNNERRIIPGRVRRDGEIMEEQIK